MRLNIGDEVTLFNQKSGQWLSIIKNIKKNVVSAEVIKKISPPMANSKISLLFSPIKYLNSESIIRQSTEIGIMNIFPTSFQRTVIRKINIDKFEFKVSITKDKYIKMLKKRFISPLVNLDKDQIIKGINEFKKIYPNKILFKDTLICIKYKN